MRAICILVLSMSLVGQSSAFLNVIGNIVNKVVTAVGSVTDLGLTTATKIVDAAVNVGSNIVKVVVDPFKIWKPSTDTDHGHSTGQVAKCPAIADIIFVMDTSSSMQSNDFSLLTDFAYRLTEHFKIGKNDARFGALVFSDRTEKVFDLSTHSDHQSLRSGLARAPFLRGGTKTYLALDYLRLGGMFSTAQGARVRSSKIAVVITDGQSDSLFKTNAAAVALKSQGVKVIVVGIASGLGIELYNIASGFKNVFPADYFNSLRRIEQTVARRICEIPQSEGNLPCQSGSGGATCEKGFVPNPSDPSTCIDLDECATNNPCQHSCINLVGSFRCTCDEGFVVNSEDSLKCDEIRPCPVVADIIFVMDASGSVGQDNFNMQLSFVSKLTKHFRYGRNAVLYGALLFASEVHKLFDLKDHATKEAVSEALLRAPYLRGGTNTNKALDYLVQSKMFSSESGGRDEAEDVVIVLTDGRSSDPSLTAASAETLKKQRVTVISIGIGDLISTDELKTIASSPDNVFEVSDFDLLDYIEQRLADRVCPRNKASG